MFVIVLTLKGKEIGRFRVASTKTTIGRGTDNDIVLDNVGISRHHASLLHKQDGFAIQDEGSQNGVFLNGRRVTLAPVGPDDTIQLGKFTLRVLQNDNGDELQGDSLNPRRRGGPRDPVRTLALEPNEVQKLLVAPSSIPPSDADPDPGTGLPLLLVVGAVLLALVGLAAILL